MGSILENQSWSHPEMTYWIFSNFNRPTGSLRTGQPNIASDTLGSQTFAIILLVILILWVIISAWANNYLGDELVS
jgi:hypothetical protein